mmetsp:Transcript_68778/g.199542  ORF Transcript_68778/g.199542 Transcript_68778/m.199542 type:complete len:181 (-) Transcript_68778:62-604(-)
MDVFDILQWKSPVVTAAVLIAFNVLYFLVLFFDVCLAPFVCNTSILFIFAGLAAKLAMPDLAIGGDDQALFSKDSVQKVSQLLNAMAAKSIDTVTWRSSSTTAKALVGLEVVRRLSPWVGVSMVLFLGVNGFFIGSWVVEKKWDLIEKKVQPQLRKIHEKKEEWKAKVPKYTDIKDQKWD